MMITASCPHRTLRKVAIGTGKRWVGQYESQGSDAELSGILGVDPT
jgi:transposase